MVEESFETVEQLEDPSVGQSESEFDDDISIPGSPVLFENVSPIISSTKKEVSLP